MSINQLFFQIFFVSDIFCNKFFLLLLFILSIFLLKFSIFFIHPLSTVIFTPLNPLLLNITLYSHQGWYLPIFFSLEQESRFPWFYILGVSCSILHTVNIILCRIWFLLYSSEDIFSTYQLNYLDSKL